MYKRKFVKKGKRSLPYKRRAVVRNAVAKSKRQGIAKVVKTVLAKQEEVKCQTYLRNVVNVGAVTTSSVTFDSANYTVLNPSNDSFAGYTIAAGTGNAQRIGNRVRTKKLVFQYTIQPKGYNATSNTVMYPFIIRFYLVKSKINPTQPISLNQVLNQFYENGTSMAGFTGDVMDLNRKVCPDTFTYLTHWDHKIGYASNNQNGNNSFQHNNNNDFKMCAYASKDLTKYCNKEIVWDDTNTINNSRLFLVWNIYSMGPSAFPITQFPCFISYNTQYFYTDA